MTITTCDKCGQYTPHSKRSKAQICWDCGKDEIRADNPKGDE